MVIPVALRRRAGFEPGTALEVEIDEVGIRLRRAVPGPSLVLERGRLLARQTVPSAKLPEIDAGALIEQEREKRS